MTKRVIALLLFAVMCLSLTGCTILKRPAKEEIVNVETAEEAVKLTDDEIVDALTEFARRYENQMLATDPYAEIKFIVHEDGSCGIYAKGLHDDGTVNEELETIKECATPREMFMNYYYAGFIDSDGDPIGLPDEIPEEELMTVEKYEANLKAIQESVEAAQDEGELPEADAEKAEQLEKVVSQNQPLNEAEDTKPEISENSSASETE